MTRRRSIWSRWGVPLAVWAVAAPALAVELGPRLRAERIRLPAAPATTPLPPLRLVGTGPEVAQLAARLRRHGLPARVRLGVLRLDLDPRRLAELAGPEAVTVDLGARLHPVLDRSAPAIGLGEVLRAQRSGRGVLVAILDTGVDFTHPDFRNADGSTRFVAYWDQTDDPPDRVCDAVDIDAGRCPNRADEPYDGFLPNGHGTHVAGIAAGSDARYRGIAPEALLVGVRLRFDEAGLIDGLAFVDELARRLSLPVVVNLSLGANEGPHDGSAPSEQAIDAFVGPGRIVVAAAGNEGAGANGPIHLRVPGDGRQYWGRFELRPELGVATPEELNLELWTDRDASWSLRLGVAEADGPLLELSAPIGVTERTEQRLTWTRAGLAVVVAAGATTQATGVRITWVRTDGTLDRTFYVAVAGDRPVDLWLPDRNAAFDTTSGPTVLTAPDGTTFPAALVGGDDRRTVTLPGTARGALTVTGYWTRVRWSAVDGNVYEATDGELGARLAIASRGPSRDGRLKPDIAAPGAYIASSLATTLSFAQDALKVDAYHWLQRGTSMAAPHVAGVAALLLEATPGLTPARLRSWLASRTEPDAATGSLPNADWGYGKLALRDVANSSVWNGPGRLDTAPPRITGVTVTPTDDGWRIRWWTDELADRLVEWDDGTWSRASFALHHEAEVPVEAGRFRIVARDLAGNVATTTWQELAGGCGCRLTGGPGVGDLVPWTLLWIGLSRRRRRSRYAARTRG